MVQQVYKTVTLTIKYEVSQVPEHWKYLITEIKDYQLRIKKEKKAPETFLRHSNFDASYMAI